MYIAYTSVLKAFGITNGHVTTWSSQVYLVYFGWNRLKPDQESLSWMESSFHRKNLFFLYLVIHVPSLSIFSFTAFEGHLIS